MSATSNTDLRLPSHWKAPLSRMGWNHGTSNAVYVFLESKDEWLRLARMKSGRWVAAILCKIERAPQSCAVLDLGALRPAQQQPLDHDRREAHERAMQLWAAHEPPLTALGIALVAVDVRVGKTSDRGAYRLTAFEVRRRR
jgi:hypothetical protein